MAEWTLLLGYLVHLGYLLQLVALLARDVLWLRALLAVAQSVVAVYAISRGVMAIAGWNLVLVSINTYWVVRILRERRAVAIPEALRQTYEAHFAALRAGEFLRFWELAEVRQVHAAELTREGQTPDALYWLSSGGLIMEKWGQPQRRVQAPCFVGEMSLLTGRAASATVRLVGDAELRAWPRAVLERLQRQQPMLWARVQSVLGLDLVYKIQREEARYLPAETSA